MPTYAADTSVSSEKSQAEIKAKLEAVEARIVDFDTEFLGQIVLPNGMTVAEHVVPEMQRAIAESDVSPTLFPPPQGTVLSKERKTPQNVPLIRHDRMYNRTY